MDWWANGMDKAHNPGFLGNFGNREIMRSRCLGVYLLGSI
jgi:hypothetical protein